MTGPGALGALGGLGGLRGLRGALEVSLKTRFWSNGPLGKTGSGTCSEEAVEGV